MKNNIFNLLKVFLFFLIITGGGNTITLSAQQSGKESSPDKSSMMKIKNLLSESVYW